MNTFQIKVKTVFENLSNIERWNFFAKIVNDFNLRYLTLF